MTGPEYDVLLPSGQNVMCRLSSNARTIMYYMYYKIQVLNFMVLYLKYPLYRLFIFLMFNRPLLKVVTFLINCNYFITLPPLTVIRIFIQTWKLGMIAQVLVLFNE